MANKSDTWRGLIDKLDKMTENEVLAALGYEVSTKNRKSLILRLHQRYTKLRMTRERHCLLNGELL